MKVIPSPENVDLIDISKSLGAPGRPLFAKIAKKSKLDELLQRRIALKMSEERMKAAKKVRN